MRSRTLLITGCVVSAIFVASGNAQESAEERSGLVVASVTVTIDGTSNRHAFLASTKTVRVAHIQLADPLSRDVLQQALQPGGLKSFDVTIPVLTLTSADEGVEEYIHDSLKAKDYPEIHFRLHAITKGAGDATAAIPLRATGTLTIAGIDRDVTLNVKVMRVGDALIVNGTTDLLMTDFGVKPPKGLFRMLNTDPAVRVRFYLVLTAATER